MKMSVLNNFSVSIGKGLRRLRDSDLTGLADKFTKATKRKGSSTPQDSHGHGPSTLNMDKCLIVSKVTRYEYEKHSHDNISDSALEKVLRKRGSDYDAMLANHNEQKAFEQKVADTLKDMGRKVELASRLTYSDDLISWCDVVVPCGGDGTFLLAASRVRDNTKPVIGFNSAPHKSVGRLCLPTWCSNDVKGSLHALKEGKFRWMRRSRIRTTVTGEPKLLDKITPIDLHTLQYCRYPPMRHDQDESVPDINSVAEENHTLCTKVLPFLALNEVFIGESVTSRVSLLRLQIDNGSWTHTKSSGLCVTTGTGSTSWHYSINCLRTHSVLELMKILSEELRIKVDTRLETAREVAEMYNQRLMFPPDSEHLAYSVREYITFEEWPTPRGLRVRDKAATVAVKSHCTDAATPGQIRQRQIAVTSTPLARNMNNALALNNSPMHKGARLRSDQLPRPLLDKNRSALDKVVDYLLKDGPNQRMALICSQCCSHNGMAMVEEFEYVSYTCAYCGYMNASRKQRPAAPLLAPARNVPAPRHLHTGAGDDSSLASSSTDSDEEKMSNHNNVKPSICDGEPDRPPSPANGELKSHVEKKQD